MDSSKTAVGLLRGSVGAILGGLLGYYIFFWMVRQGFYAIIIPGTLLGLGFGLLSGIRSMAAGIVCGALAVVLGFFAEWRVFPFIEDGSLTFFVTHVHELTPVTWIMIGLGGLFGFWLGQGRQSAGQQRGGAGSGSD